MYCRPLAGHAKEPGIATREVGINKSPRPTLRRQPRQIAVGTLRLGILPMLSSMWLAQKYLGLSGALAYGLLTLCGVAAVLVLYRSSWWDKLNFRHALLFLVAVWLLLVLIVVCVYPKVTLGSDRDEALDISAQAILGGRYPYYERTQFGNAFSPLPGSIFLAMPFYLLFGGSAYQNLFWSIVYAVLLWILYDHDLKLASLAVGMTFLLFPISLQEIATGGDLFTAGVAALSVLVIAIRGPGRDSRWFPAWLGLLSGWLLSTRFNFWFVGLAVFAYLHRKRGLREALWYGGMAGISALALVLPFALYDPANFAPLHVAGIGIVPQLSAVVPQAGTVMLLLVAAISLLAGRTANPYQMLELCAVAQFVPLVMQWLLADKLNLVAFSRGHIYLYLWLAGAAGAMLHGLLPHDVPASQEL
jgi:hypothetical protein